MGIGAGYNQLDLVGWSAQGFENLQNEILALMATNKEFARHLTDLVDLTENYETHANVTEQDREKTKWEAKKNIGI